MRSNRSDGAPPGAAGSDRPVPVTEMPPTEVSRATAPMSARRIRRTAWRSSTGARTTPRSWYSSWATPESPGASYSTRSMEADAGTSTRPSASRWRRRPSRRDFASRPVIWPNRSNAQRSARGPVPSAIRTAPASTTMDERSRNAAATGAALSVPIVNPSAVSVTTTGLAVPSGRRPSPRRTTGA